MRYVKHEQELSLIREGAAILSRVQGEIARVVNPGIATKHLNDVAEQCIRDHGGTPSFKGYNGFPAAVCISVNECVVHGIPGDYVLREGDIVAVDCGVYYKGFHSDAAFTYPVGEVSDDLMRLLKVTKSALYRGIEAAKAGNRIGDIGHAVQYYVSKRGYSVVRELVGHGIGAQLHEAPQVPNYGRRSQGRRLELGMVLAIEPMVNLGSAQIYRESGGVFKTRDGKASAHFEHTVVVMDGKAEPLTTYEYIEERFKF